MSGECEGCWAEGGVCHCHPRHAELIGKIEQIRARNNVNWMDILRLAMKHAPAQTKALLIEIEHCDGEVRRLTKELAE